MSLPMAGASRGVSGCVTAYSGACLAESRAGWAAKEAESRVTERRAGKSSVA